MANALMGGPPPVPNPTPNPNPGGPSQGAPPQQPPAPSHQQTVAALRHFDAIETELTTLLKNPDLGKTNLHSQIVDGATGLVANGIMSAGQAVTQLSNVPDEPFQQKKWVMQQYAQTVQARTAVLSHHQAAFMGQETDSTPPDPDDHASTISGLMMHYNPAQGNA